MLLEQKNLERIILDKVPGMSGTPNADKNPWGLAGWPRGGFCPTWFMLLVGLQPELLPVMEVTRLRELCPLVLIFGREVTRLKVCGAEMRRGRIFMMPPCVQWLDGAQPRGAVLYARLGQVTLGPRGGQLRQQLPLEKSPPLSQHTRCPDHGGKPGPKVRQWGPAWLGLLGRGGLQSESESEFSSESQTDGMLGGSFQASGAWKLFLGRLAAFLAVGWSPGLRLLLC